MAKKTKIRLNLIKQNILKILVVSLLIIVCSCSSYTKKLWTSQNYDETFKSFLTTGDGKFVVFLSDNYHYAFYDNSGLMKRILFMQEKRLLINVKKSYIKLNKTNDISGHVVVEALESLFKPDQIRFLRQLGFKDINGNLSIVIDLYGKRYLAADDPNNSKTNLPSLSLPYKMKVNYDPKVGEFWKKAGLTPLTVIADIVVTFGRVLIFPFKN